MLGIVVLSLGLGPAVVGNWACVSSGVVLVGGGGEGLTGRYMGWPGVNPIKVCAIASLFYLIHAVHFDVFVLVVCSSSRS